MIRNPGKPWSGEDDAILLTHYEERGSHFCRSLMPHRSVGSIQQRAFRLELTSKVNPADSNQDLYPIPEPDKLLLAAMRNWYVPEQGGQLRRIV